MKKFPLHDAIVYVWASVAILALAGVAPPIVLLWLLFPRWHRRRVSRRYIACEQARYAARVRWLENL